MNAAFLFDNLNVLISGIACRFFLTGIRQHDVSILTVGWFLPMLDSER